MLFQHVSKVARTLFVLSFFSLSNVFAQNLMQTKGDSSAAMAQTTISTSSAIPIKQDSTAQSEPLKAVVTQSQMVVKGDATLKTVVNSPTKPIEDESNVYKFVDEQPEFEGGLTAFFKYVNANLQMPPEALKERVDGRAFLSFVVNTDGSISNVTVRRTTYTKRSTDDKVVEVDAQKDKTVIEALNNEAVRVITAMPKWKPGKQGGLVVRSAFAMPVSFQ
jgi:periplasmic protein TonB